MKPPCKKEGYDCDKRAVGCKEDCDEYKKFDEWVKEERKRRQVKCLGIDNYESHKKKKRC